MKKILIISLLLFMLTGCVKEDNTIDASSNERYQDLVTQLQAREDFKSSSEFFDINFDIASIDGGYRYYVTIDNVKVAMYEIEAIAIEKNVDYSSTMAANIGLFEDIKYSIIPGQVSINDGFVKGINISGTTSNENPTLYVCVIWHNKDLSITHREYFKLEKEETQTEVIEETNSEDIIVDENNEVVSDEGENNAEE